MRKLKYFLILIMMIISTTLSGQEYTKIKKVNTRLLPTTITVGPQKDIYIADGLSGSIIKYNSKWKYEYTLNLKGVKSIVDLFYTEGYIYGLSGEGKIFRFTPDGKVDFFRVYEKGSLLGELSNPAAIFVEKENIYISDSGNNRIQIFDKSGKVIRDFGYKTFTISGFMFNTGLSKANDNILVADSGTKEVKIYDKDGFYLNNLKDESGKEFIFNTPEEVFVDKDNNIYVVDAGTNQIFIYSIDGTLKKIGKKGTKKTEFYGIRDIWVDDNYIYVADTLNEKIKILDKNTYELVKAIGVSNFMKITSFIVIILVLIIMFSVLKRIKRKKGEKLE